MSAPASASPLSLPLPTHQLRWRTTQILGGKAPPGPTPHRKALEATERQGGRVGAVRVSWPGALSVVFVFPEVEDLAWLAFLK